MTNTLFDRLAADWTSLRRSSSWRRFQTVLESHPDLADLCGGRRSADPAVELRRTGRVEPDRADRQFVALLQLGRTEPLAQRTVLQAILPGLLQISGRMYYGSGRDELDEKNDWLISVAADRIASYPAERRSRAVPGNILLDVRRDFVRDSGRMAVVDAPLDDPEGVHGSSIDWNAEAAFVHVEDRLDVVSVTRSAFEGHVLSDRDVDVIIRTRLLDRDVTEVAACIGISDHTLRRARNRAERRIRDHALSPAA